MWCGQRRVNIVFDEMRFTEGYAPLVALRRRGWRIIEGSSALKM